MELSILPAAANRAINHGTETYWGTCNLHMKVCMYIYSAWTAETANHAINYAPDVTTILLMCIHCTSCTYTQSCTHICMYNHVHTVLVYIHALCSCVVAVP